MTGVSVAAPLQSRLGLTRLGLARLGLTRLGLARLGSARLDAAPREQTGSGPGIISRMRNHSTILVGLLASLSCAPAWGADSALINFAPPDSGVVIGINLEQIKASSFGKVILSKLDNADLRKFVASVGFDPLRDLHEILIAAPAGKQKSRVLFLLRGAFDPAPFAGLTAQPGMSASTYQGVQILSIQGQAREPMCLARLNGSLIVGGDPESVRAAISRRGEGPGPNAELSAKAAEMSLLYDIWLVSRVSPADLTGNAPEAKLGGNAQMQLLRSIEQASGGVKFGPNLLITADLTTHTPKDAEGIAAVLRLFIGLAAANQRDPKAAAMLRKLALKAEDNSVKLSFSIPEAELAQAVQSSMNSMMEQMKKGSAQEATAPPKPPPTGVTIYSSPRDMGIVTLPAPKQ